MALGDVSQSLAPAPQSDYMDDTAIRRKRALAEALMQQGSDTSPIRSPWQGVARLVQGLMGGIHEASADRAEHENNAYNSELMKGILTPSASAEGSVAPRPAMLTANSPAAGGVASMTPKGDLENYIAQAAAKRGIDPNTALRVYGSEGKSAYVGDQGSSFGPFQMHYGNIAPGGNRVAGMGDDFTKATGLDARNPETVNQQIDFALDQAKKNGWGAWHGAQKVGIGQFDGINGAPVQVASNDANGAFGMAANGAPAAQNGQAQRLLAAMADPRLSAQNKQVLMMMYQNATKDEGKPHYSAPHMDAQGNLVQEELGSNKTDILTQAQRAAPTTPTREIQNFQYGKEHPDFAEAQKKAPTMDPDTVDFLAGRVLAGDNSGLVGLGRGAQGAENIGAVQARVAQLAHERGIDATGMLRNMAHAAGMKAGARTLEQYNAKMGPLEKRVESAANYAADLSDKIPRGSVVPWNQLTQGIQKNLSDPNLRDLNVRINTLVNEYAAAVGGGNGTDATRAHAREMLSMADSPETFRRIVNSMVREVQFSHQAARDALGEMYNPAGEGGAPSPAPTAAPAGQTKSGVKWTVE
jgi:hypothetical protein